MNAAVAFAIYDSSQALDTCRVTLPHWQSYPCLARFCVLHPTDMPCARILDGYTGERYASGRGDTHGVSIDKTEIRTDISRRLTAGMQWAVNAGADICVIAEWDTAWGGRQEPQRRTVNCTHPPDIVRAGRPLVMRRDDMARVLAQPIPVVGVHDIWMMRACERANIQIACCGPHHRPLLKKDARRICDDLWLDNCTLCHGFRDSETAQMVIEALMK